MLTARRAVLLTISLFAVVATGCGSDTATTSTGSTGSTATTTTPSTAPDQLPTRTPDVGGVITSLVVGTGPAAGSIVVEASTGVTDAYTYGAASLTVPADAPIGTCGPADGREYGSFDDLATGTYVVAWVDGPVAESYPVQATASAVALVCG